MDCEINLYSIKTDVIFTLDLKTNSAFIKTDYVVECHLLPWQLATLVELYKARPKKLSIGYLRTVLGPLDPPENLTYELQQLEERLKDFGALDLIKHSITASSYTIPKFWVDLKKVSNKKKQEADLIKLVYT